METPSNHHETLDERTKAYKSLRKMAIRKMYTAPPINPDSLYVPDNPAAFCITPSKDKMGIERQTYLGEDQITIDILKRTETGEHLTRYTVPKNGVITRADSELSAFGMTKVKIPGEMGIAVGALHRIGQLIGANSAQKTHADQGLDGLPITAEEADMLASLIDDAQYDCS